MKTQDNKLNFNTKVVVELNDSNLSEIEGGTTLACFMASYVISRDLFHEC